MKSLKSTSPQIIFLIHRSWDFFGICFVSKSSFFPFPTYHKYYCIDVTA